MLKQEQLQPLFETSLKPLIGRGNNTFIASEDTVTVNTAFSISEKGLPARFLAGFIPAILVTQLIKEQQEVSPTIRTFVPLHLGLFCNEINRERGMAVVNGGRTIMEKFLTIYHPNVSWRMDFDQSWTDEATYMLAYLWEAMFENGDAQLEQIRIQNVESATKHGNGNSVERTDLYATHHVFGWQDCQSNLFFNEQDPQPTVVLNCMSSSEKRFQKIRERIRAKVQVLNPELLGQAKRLDLITTRCPGPHYLRSGENGSLEPSLDDLLSEGFTATVRSIYRLMECNPKFSTALKDLLLVGNHIQSLWEIDPNLPTIDEFLKHLS